MKILSVFHVFGGEADMQYVYINGAVGAMFLSNNIKQATCKVMIKNTMEKLNM